MEKSAAKKLHEEILQLADHAFTLDLRETGKQLMDCAEYLRQLITVTEEENTL